MSIGSILQANIAPKKNDGFTLVELILVVVVIGILATVVSLALPTVLEEGRDKIRQSSVTTIAEALEKYYSTHGEYPSCSALTASPASISQNTLKGIDEAVFRSPSAESGVSNSIRCTNIEGDFYIYTVNSDLLSWTLRYTKEVDGSTEEIVSRAMNGVVATDPDPEPDPDPGAPDPDNPMIPNKPFDMAQLKVYCLSSSNAPAGYNLIIATPTSDTHGTAGDDIIYRSSGTKDVFAYGGNDIICASNSNGDIFAGDGDNVIAVSQSNSDIEGGSGIDFILKSNGGGDVFGFDGNDVFYIENGSPNVDGGAGDDMFYVRNGSPDIFGGSGWDRAKNFSTSNANYSSIEEFLL